MTPERELAERLLQIASTKYCEGCNSDAQPFEIVVTEVQAEIEAFKESEIAKFKQSLVE